MDKRIALKNLIHENMWIEGINLINWAAENADDDEIDEFLLWVEESEDNWVLAFSSATPRENFSSCPYTWDELRAIA